MVQGHIEKTPVPILQHSLWMLLLTGSILLGCDGHGPSPGEFDPTEVGLVEVRGKNLMELTDEKLTFVDSKGVKWIAPKGTWTDGATVPRLALWITDGRFQKEFLKAAIIHDAHCQKFNADRCPEQYRKKPWKDVHRMFYEACVAGKTSALKTKLMFAAVWWGGPRWDDPDSDLQIVPDDMLGVGYLGCKKWIEDNNPTLQSIESWMDNREPTILAVAELQSKFISALRTGDLAAADSALQQSDERLAEALNKLPNDLMLLNLKGYQHKNRAMNYGELKMGDKEDEELNKAERIFQVIIALEPQDPSALNGLGSVSILRNDLDRAEDYVRRALDIEPNYPAAKHDLELIERLRQSQPPE
jgi:uncharacterized protein DUF1353